ncbi:Transcriptional regulatory protein TcrA [Variovorax sp. PBS-H4]|uniref:response regulator n=1 Tax=Variovorax sp. PBS-H4 TaxID=434008 RepID=UPI001317D685|nr:response regulator [Variovorax sp. PBS-H4]VTU37166.1 Transcriptional regulatory protein TcrA [Variovorax sp. PBS-H4]
MASEPACSTDACCSLRVLVVEDDPEVLEASLEALELLGHWATGVRSAEGAIDRFLEGAFDVLMADVGLPGLSGLELADKLQSRCGLPIIFATASKPPERTLPGTLWLCKPFSIEQLGEALRQAARLRPAPVPPSMLPSTAAPSSGALLAR